MRTANGVRNVVVLGCLLVASFSTGVVPADDESPRVAVDRVLHDFGRVPRGTVVSAGFTLRNLGSAPLSIESMQFSTPGMRARVSASIEPGESAPIEIVWDTSQYTREAVGQAALMLNDPETPTLVLTLQGFVVSPIEIDPAPAFYLSQFTGDSASQMVTIRVNQERDIVIRRVEQQGSGFDVGVVPVEAGREYAVEVTTSRELAPGRYRHAAILHTSDPDRPRIRLEVNILVKTLVHASVEAIDMGRVRIASLRANPSLLELIRQTVILESRTPEMQITGLESDLPFVTLEREPHTPAQRVRIDVGLAPSKLKPGRYSGTVRIDTDVPGAGEVSLPIEITVVD